MRVISGLNSEAISCCFGSIHWISGIAYLLASAIHSATRIITTDPYSPELLFAIIAKHRITECLFISIYLQPLLQCSLTYQADLSSLDCVVLGGNLIPKTIRQQMAKLLPKCKQIHMVYGMSEVSGPIAINKTDIGLASVGQLVNGLQMRVINDAGELCGPNEDGELLLLSDPPILGYVMMNDEEAISGAASHLGSDHQQNWFRTGDIGRFDDNHLLYINCRIKDMITYNGRIYPGELENVILGTKRVSGVCVVGIPTSELNDLLAALIVPTETEPKVTEAEIYAVIQGKYIPTKSIIVIYKISDERKLAIIIG